MKITKTLVVTLLAGFSLYQTALCQTNAADTTPAPAVASDTATNSAAAAAPAPAESGSQPASTTATNASAGMATAAPAEAAATNMPAVAEPAAASAATASNAPAMTSSGNESAGTESTNATAAASAPAGPAQLPISFQDVPLTTAIESLARLANINYLLDPKIGYGQPDQNGQVKPEPTLTIRWENVTAEKALLALLDNYGLQLVENPKTGIYKITTKDPTAPPPLMTRVIQLKYASTSNMMAAVVNTLSDKRSKVVGDQRTSQLVVVATEREQSDVDTLVEQLDKPTRQVLIETRLVELSSNPSTQKGIDWSGTLQAQNIGFGNNVVAGATGSPYTTTLSQAPLQGFVGGALTNIGLINTITYSQNNLVGSPGILADTQHGFNPSTFFLNADGVNAVLSFLNSSSEAQVVSVPRVVTLDNETATITVTRAFPIINITAGTVQTAGGSQVTYSNLGTILQVTPRISANDYIWLKVSPSVSSFFGKDTETINGQLNTADIFDMRTVDTQVLIPNAHTLVMGGLVKDNPNAQYTKVPFLGDIPILGLAFRHENKSLEKDNLLIFLTPTIVKDTDFQPTTTDFLNSKPRTMKDPMDPHTKWDSAQPNGDWSNPLSSEDVDKNKNQAEVK